MATVPAPREFASKADMIRWAFEVLNTHDVGPLRSMWSTETIERFPTGTCTGPDEIGDYFGAAFLALPDFHMEIIALAQQGDDVFVRWRLTGTHTGASWQGIAPTGRAIELDGIDHFVVRDETIASNFVVFDQMQFARAIGMMPADGSLGDRALKGAFNAKTRISQRARDRSGAGG